MRRISVESKVNVVEVEAACSEELNLVIMMEALMEDCLKFLYLALMSGLVNACWKYERKAKKGVLRFSSHNRGWLKRHCKNLLDWSIDRQNTIE